MSDGLRRQFEGRARLEKLLSEAGSLADAQDVAEAFRQAQKEGVPVSVVVDALFEDEPKFPSPADARALYGNLFGLWDLLEAGEKVDLDKPPERARPPKPEKLDPPEPFEGEPDAAWVEYAWRYLDTAPPKERHRLNDAFENRQDGLLNWLDQTGLSDAGFGLAREVLFEMFALIELGGRKLPPVFPEDAPKDAPAIPAALQAHADETVFEAEHDESAPVTDEALAQAKTAIDVGLKALWAAAAKKK